MLRALRNTGIILSFTWRSRTIAVLIAGLLLIGPAVIGLHALVHSEDEQPRLVLFQAPDLHEAALLQHMLYEAPATQESPSGFGAIFATSDDGRPGFAYSTKTLDAIYRVFLPLIMVLIGANILPHSKRIYASLFSTPGGRSAQFALYACAVVLLVTFLSAALYAANLAALGVCQASWPGAWRMLGEFHLLNALYGMVFATIGFVLSIMVSHRTTALVSALAISLFLVGVAPQTYLIVSQNYARSQLDRIAAAESAEVLADDPLARAIGLLGRLPASGQGAGAYFLARLFGPSSRGCTSCGTSAQERAAVNRTYRDLAVTSALFLTLGAACFARREAGS